MFREDYGRFAFSIARMPWYAIAFMIVFCSTAVLSTPVRKIIDGSLDVKLDSGLEAKCLCDLCTRVPEYPKIKEKLQSKMQCITPNKVPDTKANERPNFVNEGSQLPFISPNMVKDKKSISILILANYVNIALIPRATKGRKTVEQFTDNAEVYFQRLIYAFSVVLAEWLGQIPIIFEDGSFTTTTKEGKTVINVEAHWNFFNDYGEVLWAALRCLDMLWNDLNQQHWASIQDQMTVEATIKFAHLLQVIKDASKDCEQAQKSSTFYHRLDDFFGNLLRVLYSQFPRWMRMGIHGGLANDPFSLEKKYLDFLDKYQLDSTSFNRCMDNMYPDNFIASMDDPRTPAIIIPMCIEKDIFAEADRLALSPSNVGPSVSVKSTLNVFGHLLEEEKGDDIKMPLPHWIQCLKLSVPDDLNAFTNVPLEFGECLWRHFALRLKMRLNSLNRTNFFQTPDAAQQLMQRMSEITEQLRFENLQVGESSSLLSDAEIQNRSEEQTCFEHIEAYFHSEGTKNINMKDSLQNVLVDIELSKQNQSEKYLFLINTQIIEAGLADQCQIHAWAETGLDSEILSRVGKHMTYLISLTLTGGGNVAISDAWKGGEEYFRILDEFNGGIVNGDSIQRGLSYLGLIKKRLVEDDLYFQEWLKRQDKNLFKFLSSYLELLEISYKRTVDFVNLEPNADFWHLRFLLFSYRAFWKSVFDLMKSKQSESTVADPNARQNTSKDGLFTNSDEDDISSNRQDIFQDAKYLVLLMLRMEDMFDASMNNVGTKDAMRDGIIRYFSIKDLLS